MVRGEAPLVVDYGKSYEIRVEGHLDERYAGWFEGMTLQASFLHGRPITVLSGVLIDQAALHGVLTKLHAMGISLLTLEQT